MRKYLFYIHALSGGGAERVWSVLASAMAERGHDVVLAVDYQAEDNLPFLSPAVRLRVLGGGHGQTILRLARLLKAERPDVAVGALAAASLKLTAAATLARTLDRTVLSYHGYAESEPQRLSQLGFLAAPLLTRVTARTVCVSDGLLTYLRQRWHAAAGKTLRLYNPVAGIEPGDGTMAVDLAERAPVVLAAGRLVPYKNFVGLVQAFAAVSPPDARLVILGEGPDRDAITAEIARLGLGSRVDLPGYLREPWATFRAARCFALASHSESFGLVVVEALAHGLPVVATDCDGPREILSEPEVGTLVPQGDPAALAAAISAALADPGRPEPRVLRANDFSVAAAAERYDTLFQDVAARAAPLGRTATLRPTLVRKFSLALALVVVAIIACCYSPEVRAQPEFELLRALLARGATLSSWLLP